MVGAIGDRERHRAVAAVNRRRRGVDEVQKPRQAPHRLQQHHVAIDVAVQVGVRVDQRIADAGLRRQMHDPVDLAFVREDGGYRIAVGDVEAQEGKARPAFEPRQPRFLQRDLVIVVQVVDADHGLTAAEESFGDVVAYKACHAGDQNAHPVPFSARHEVWLPALRGSRAGRPPLRLRRPS